MKKILNFIAGFFALILVLAITGYTMGPYIIYRSFKNKSYSLFFTGLFVTFLNVLTWQKTLKILDIF